MRGLKEMEGGSGPYSPRTAEEVFKDFRGRRAGMIKALTTGTLSLLSFLSFSSISVFLFHSSWNNFLAIFFF